MEPLDPLGDVLVPPRAVKRAIALVVGVLVVIVLGVGPVVHESAASQRLGFGAEPSIPAGEGVFGWPGDCTKPAIGNEVVTAPDLAAESDDTAWTSSRQGRWLRQRLNAAGYHDVVAVGSAFVLLHGVDAVTFVWFGPPSETAELELERVGRVESTELEPTVPFDTGAYRPSVVDTVVAGGVRLWLLTHARDGYELINFPGLTTAPCLPKQNQLRKILLRISAAAKRQPFRGELPPTAGRFAVNSDQGLSTTDPGDIHLAEVAGRALDRSVIYPGLGAPSLDGSGIFIYTGIPPHETGANVLASTKEHQANTSTPRATAGGLDVLLLLQGVSLDDTTTRELIRIVEELNRDPFLGQPSPGR
jgi:hypothetical protein